MIFNIWTSKVLEKMTKKKYLILSILLIVVYLSIAVIAFSFANLSREEIFDKGYIVGFLLALSSIPYLFIYLIEDGFHKPQKAVYGAFGIIGIAIGLTSFFLEKKDMDVYLVVYDKKAYEINYTADYKVPEFMDMLTKEKMTSAYEIRTKMKDLIDENTMIRLADNGSNVDVLSEIFKGLIT